MAAIKLFISPSTQDGNLGPNGYVEAVQMNLIADILIPELKRHGFNVMRNNRYDTFNGHIAKSKAFRPDYHIAMHSNATGASQPKTARGCSVYCKSPATLPNSPGVLMAKALYARFTPITPTADRGILDGIHNLSEVAYTTNGTLTEIDFHDNALGAAWIVSHKPEIANAYLRGILDRTGVAYIPPVIVVPPPDPEPEPDPETDPEPPTLIYRVQIGQFYVQANAEQLADRAEAAGFPATIRTEEIVP